ncbi:MAG TPA: formylglycine-generating enzyme family protein [Candidatus Parabacteroides intestinigallinarum]|uniref:Formylglycine-generating enzyme family protein n=1 Tax=Candidatus Parabacteroides intestinigallinarum TaxID=2838722 RepID=A0A9D1XPS9_9BACT|nr:formylglycine-generating enzyme family protein [Candidatus Parabacteroides intestinigallinarum]
MKTLYIQITSSPAPEESAGLMVYPADMSNYFCNYLEYELVDGLRMPDGTPCYKEMRPGSLLLAFATEHEEAYQSIQRQWENIQRDLLRKEPAPDTRYEVVLPKEYIEWLLNQEGFIHQKVGERLSGRSWLSLSAEGLYEEIIPPMMDQTLSFLQTHKKEFGQFTFSDNGIKSAFLIVKRLKQTDKNLTFLRNLSEKDRHSHLEFTVNGVSFTMIRVQTAHFYLGRFPVTQRLWRAVMGTNEQCLCKRDNYPVEKVSWYDCQNFIQRLSLITGKSFRLPTEAEWEYAAKGGAHSKRFNYAGGNNSNEVAWHKGNSRENLHEVGLKRPNELGLYDMSGNVYEWCEDGYKTRQDDEVSARGVRGGNYLANKEYCRITSRYAITPNYRDHGVGFRLALTL